MKKNNWIISSLTGVILLCCAPFISPSFAQEEENGVEDVEEAEEVEIAEDSIVIVAPSDMVLSPEVEVPSVPDELIADRLSCLEKDIKLTYNNTIRSFIDYFTVRNRNYIMTMERRRNLYFPIFEEYLKKHNMPDELKYLSIVESGLNPRAISRAGAAGLWQFMPSTGKIYKLHQDAYIDERLDPYQSTEAACKYLKELYNIFNDWELALASYNCGPGNVRKAIRRSGYKDTFWEIYRYLPRETRGYVPQFVAVIYAMNHLKDHNIIADTLEYPMLFENVPVTSNMNIEKLCEELNICMEDFQKLNPAIKKNVLPGNHNYTIRIPSDRMHFFAENRLAILDSCAKDCDKEITLIKTQMLAATQQRKIIYTVRRGDYLGKIAERYHVGLSELKRWNNLRSSNIRIGQRLVIYKKGTYVPPQQTNLAKSNSSSSRSKVYYVQPGDTLWEISRKNNMTIDELKRKNNLKGNQIKVGMKLIIG